MHLYQIGMMCNMLKKINNKKILDNDENDWSGSKPRVVGPCSQCKRYIPKYENYCHIGKQKMLYCKYCHNFDFQEVFGELK